MVQKEVESLTQLLADTYAFYYKAQVYHWNVVDPLFHHWHAVFEQAYTYLATITDEIAEQIRVQGGFVISDLTLLLSKSQLTENHGKPSGLEAAKDFLQAHEVMIPQLQALIPKTSDALADLLTGYLQWHEKNAWMLKSCQAS